MVIHWHNFRWSLLEPPGKSREDKGQFFFCIRLGEQSFKHADVLSEKINFSAPGGPKSTIFDTDDVDPLYFEVSIVSAPPDHPY